jgi:choline monooxygenase
MKQFYIDPDISKAETLPGYFYHDKSIFESMKDQIFASSWQLIGDKQLIRLANSAFPFSLLDGYLNEPMVLVRTEDDIVKCLSNVCTHRGNIIVHNPGSCKFLICMYHGRRFNQNGTFISMPEFNLTENFPRPCDDLHAFNLIEWGPFLFTSISPTFDFHKILSIMNERIGFLPLEEFVHQPSLGKDYLVNAHWALYCDNYLEGFHIPFVHQDLNSVLDYGQYTTELYDYCNLQIGYAKDGEECFTLPEGHPDYGKSIAAYYYWIFPNMMFNFYPWGLSINIVKPISIDKTKVSFITYVYDESALHSGAGAMLDKVEREDEYVVENVFKGLKSRVYSTGRFSVNREQGTHHFHRILSELIISEK